MRNGEWHAATPARALQNRTSEYLQQVVIPFEAGVKRTAEQQ